MAYTGLRNDVFASYRGREYTATPLFADGTLMIRSFAGENPDPELFEWNQYLDAWQARVPASNVDRLYQAVTYARYQGHLVQIDSVDESGQALAYLADGDGLWGAQNGFEQVDKYVRSKLVPSAELVDVYEKQEDMLFDRWRDATFPAPAGTGKR